MDKEVESTKVKSLCYDVVKVAVILLVVTAHVTRMYTGYGTFTPVVESRPLKLLTEYIDAFHMPLFIMMSGCVYGYGIEKGKYRERKAFIEKKARRLLIPYYCFGICYMAPVMLALGLTQKNFEGYVWQELLLAYDPGHLGYLFTLFEIYVIAMCVRSLLDRYLWLVMGVSLGGFLLYSKIPQFLQLQNTLRYQVYFFMGVCLNRHFAKLWKGMKYWKVLLPGTMLLLGARVMLPWNRMTEISFGVIGSAMILTLAGVIAVKHPKIRENKCYDLLSKNGYGWYLIHPMIIYTIFYFMKDYKINAYGLSLGVIGITTALSIWGTIGIRKTRIGLFIGEYN